MKNFTKDIFTVLGIETSCDETAAAVVRSDKSILSNSLIFQQENIPYGGVVPEITSRAHILNLEFQVQNAIAKANIEFADIDAVAVTAGPGLIGGLMVGILTAKAIAASLYKPFIAVNHLEAHALTIRLIEEVEFPYLLLLMSGGHCQFLIVKNIGQYELLGSTLDDAIGEAYDKVAKMLGLEYPGGPKIEQMAKKGNNKRFNFPRAMMHEKNCNLSFSGLKTSVKNMIKTLDQPLVDKDKADICASFQAAILDILASKLNFAINTSNIYNYKTVVLAGGVAANIAIRSALNNICVNNNLRLLCPPVNLCTDNAAMVAWAGIELAKQNKFSTFDFEPRARWPLIELEI